MSPKWFLIQFMQITLIIVETMANVLRLETRQFVPLSPCPQIFQYENALHGIAFVPSSVYENFYAYRIVLKVQLRVRGHITHRQGRGKIELLYDISTTLDQMARGQPLKYRIDFPYHPTTPAVINITLNGMAICNGRRSYVNEVNSDIHLQHGFTYVMPSQPLNSAPSNPATVNVDRTTERSGRRIEDKKSVDCGKQAASGKSADGRDKDIASGTWPWLVAIFLKTADGGLVFKCSGNLLSNRIVLSAAHCFMKYSREYALQPADLLLAFGRYNLLDWTAGGKDLSDVERIEVPDDYLTEGDFSHHSDSDIAVLIAQEFIEYTAVIKPICLWPSVASSVTNDIEGLTGMLVKWRAPSRGDVVNVPRQLRMNIVPTNLCSNRNSMGSATKRPERIFCAESGAAYGPCNYDSGAGLAIRQNGAWFLRGVLNGCKRNQYVILTDTSKFRAWITKWINQFQFLNEK